MNQRILELARQSGGIDMTNHTAGGTTTWIGTGTPEFLERFAELIVQECIDQVEVFNARMDARPRHIAAAIREHFGVEE